LELDNGKPEFFGFTAETKTINLQGYNYYFRIINREPDLLLKKQLNQQIKVTVYHDTQTKIGLKYYEANSEAEQTADKYFHNSLNYNFSFREKKSAKDKLKGLSLNQV